MLRGVLSEPRGLKAVRTGKDLQGRGSTYKYDIREPWREAVKGGDSVRKCELLG